VTANGEAGTYCPSSAPDVPGAVVLGVVGGPGRAVTYLADPVPVTEEVLGLLGSVPAGRVLRIAAPCQEGACPHFAASTGCSLITKIARALPEAGDGTVPRCHLRARCRWWQQEQVAACRRCPVIQTDAAADTALQRWVADPATTADEFDPRDFPAG